MLEEMMNVKVLGFKFDQKDIPPALPASSVFELMAGEPGKEILNKYLYGTKRMTFNIPGGTEDWWAGIVMKVRNAKAFTKLTDDGGKRVITAQKLGAKERLAEVNFLIANPKTGSGLYTYHHQSVSPSDFATVCYKLFADNLGRCREKALEGIPPGNEAKAIRRSHKGALHMERLCRPEGFGSLLKKLKTVKSVQATLSTVELRSSFLRGLIEKAKSETITFRFPTDVDVLALADDIEKVIGNDIVHKFSVSGQEDEKGKVKTFNPQRKNPLVFDEMDYDSAMGDLNLDLDDWNDSIEKSSLIKKLHTISLNPNVRCLLT